MRAKKCKCGCRTPLNADDARWGAAARGYTRECDPAITTWLAKREWRNTPHHTTKEQA